MFANAPEKHEGYRVSLHRMDLCAVFRYEHYDTKNKSLIASATDNTWLADQRQRSKLSEGIGTPELTFDGCGTKTQRRRINADV